jgi:hypothetical protein
MKEKEELFDGENKFCRITFLKLEEIEHHLQNNATNKEEKVKEK